jgi:hypothetical protein
MLWGIFLLPITFGILRSHFPSSVFAAGWLFRPRFA